MHACCTHHPKRTALHPPPQAPDSAPTTLNARLCTHKPNIPLSSTLHRQLHPPELHLCALLGICQHHTVQSPGPTPPVHPPVQTPAAPTSSTALLYIHLLNSTSAPVTLRPQLHPPFYSTPAACSAVTSPNAQLSPPLCTHSSTHLELHFRPRRQRQHGLPDVALSPLHGQALRQVPAAQLLMAAHHHQLLAKGHLALDAEPHRRGHPLRGQRSSCWSGSCGGAQRRCCLLRNGRGRLRCARGELSVWVKPPAGPGARAYRCSVASQRVSRGEQHTHATWCAPWPEQLLVCWAGCDAGPIHALCTARSCPVPAA